MGSKSCLKCISRLGPVLSRLPAAPPAQAPISVQSAHPAPEQQQSLSSALLLILESSRALTHEKKHQKHRSDACQLSSCLWEPLLWPASQSCRPHPIRAGELRSWSIFALINSFSEVLISFFSRLQAPRSCCHPGVIPALPSPSAAAAQHILQPRNTQTPE